MIKMLKNQKIKLTSGMLVLAAALSGCGNQKQNNVTTTTTQAKATEVSEVKNEVVEVNENNYYDLAAESYNNYTKFYSVTGIAYEDETANCGINISRIENAIKVINGEVKDLTPSEVTDAKEVLGYILLPQDLVSQADDIIARNLGYIEDNDGYVVESPKLSIYATDEETKKVVEQYEILRDKAIEEINTTNNISESLKDELRNKVVEMEKEYLPDETNMNNDVSAEGNKLLENLAKESLVELTALLTNESKINTNEFPGGLQLILETDEQRDIQSKALIHGKEILTDKEKEIYADATMRIVVTKYEDGVCSHLQNLIDHANDNSNTYSKEELQEIKAYLESYNTKNLTYTLSI